MSNMLHLQPALATADLRERARKLLDALPPNGELYWHGANGKPCPCHGCCAGALIRLGQTSEAKRAAR